MQIMKAGREVRLKEEEKRNQRCYFDYVNRIIHYKCSFVSYKRHKGKEKKRKMAMVLGQRM